MANYHAGRRTEWKARDILKRWGCHTVIRAAGSKGQIDLVGIGQASLRLIQVKRNRRISTVDLRALRSLKSLLPFHCSLEVWTFTAGKQEPEVEVL